MPEDGPTSATWNVAVMELGALVCQARAPAATPARCRTSAPGSTAGRPAHDGPPRRGQAWHGTDRQVRGAVLRVLRDAPGPVTRAALEDAGADAAQVDRCIASLVEDGLLEPAAGDRFRLPA